MQKKLLTLLLALFVLVSSVTGYAALPVKQKPAISAAAVAADQTATTKTTSHWAHLLATPHRIIGQMKARLHYNDFAAQKNKPGWPGIVALVTGILGLFSIWLLIPFSLAAMIFGIVGLNRRYKNQGLALAGLILGAVELAIFLIVLIVVASFVVLL